MNSATDDIAVPLTWVKGNAIQSFNSWSLFNFPSHDIPSHDTFMDLSSDTWGARHDTDACSTDSGTPVQGLNDVRVSLIHASLSATCI